MRERFNKVYISAREFLNSWEKEVYELTYLDYFIYVLINELGLILEDEFFDKINPDEPFCLHKEEISSLAFNIGDGLQLFLEKNCFGGCSLGCPNKLSTPFTKDEDAVRIEFVTTEFDGVTASCTNREDCLYHDVLNYVVLDALLDFYNYDMGVILHEKDRRLNKLAAFIMDHIIRFTYQNGAKLLKNPSELAADLFSKDLQGEDLNWSEEQVHPDEPEEDDADVWKLDHVSLSTVFDSYCTENIDQLKNSFVNKLFTNFRKFLDEYLEVNRVDELEFEYIEEFFLIIFPQEFLMDDDVDLILFDELFSQLFEYIDITTNTSLLEPYKLFRKKSLKEVMRTFSITRRYHKENSYINFLLTNDISNPKLFEGYFEVVECKENHIKFRDIDLKSYHNNINIGSLFTEDLKKGDIFHLQVNTELPEWKITYLELIYPEASKYFLY